MDEALSLSDKGILSDEFFTLILEEHYETLEYVGKFEDVHIVGSLTEAYLC